MTNNEKHRVILEKRIARLENLLKCEASELNMSQLQDNLTQIFDDRFCGGDYFGSARGFKDAMISMSEDNNSEMVDDAIDWLVDDYGYDRSELEDCWDNINSWLVSLADDVVVAKDDDWDEWLDECWSRRVESRNRKVSRRITHH